MKITKHGFSLIESLVIIAVMAVAGLALTNLNVTGMKANKSALIRSDVMDVKRTITNLLSCDQTLGAARPAPCLPSVVLKDKNGNPFLQNGKLGDWTITAGCEVLGASGPGLSIKATKPIAGSNPVAFKIDPINNLPLDSNHPVSMLFAADVRPCANNFRTSTGSLVPESGLACVKINTNTNSYPSTAPACNSGLCCAAMCPAGHILTGGGVTGQDIWASLPLDSMTGWYGNFSTSSTNLATPPSCVAVCCKIP